MRPGLPAGRAGRAWLAERLAAAERAVELLDGKLRVLQREQRRYHLQVERTRSSWERSCTEAGTWSLRAVLLGGRRALRDAVPADPAAIDVSWTVVMGVRHPRDAVVNIGRPAADATTPSNTALVQAVSAYRTALDAAARYAVAEAAATSIDTEVAATRRRLRAIRDRHVPGLRTALAAVELELEELEHEDGIRLRRAAARAGRARPEET